MATMTAVDPCAQDAPLSVDRRSTGTSPAVAPSSPPASAVYLALLRVVPWRDPVVDAMGIDPRSLYAEQFWLPIVGPTATWLLRRVAVRFEQVEAGFFLDVDDTARCLGLGWRKSRNSPFFRAISRCVAFGLARWQGHDEVAVRRLLPPLAQRQLVRLPPSLQEAHRRWTFRSASRDALESQRRRARRLALGLIALGESLNGAESQLVRWGVHPALTDEAVRWARGLEQHQVPPAS